MCATYYYLPALCTYEALEFGRQTGKSVLAFKFYYILRVAPITPPPLLAAYVVAQDSLGKFQGIFI